MQTQFPTIQRFLSRQHVLTLCASDGEDIWCANCFYWFDVEAMALVIMTEPGTRHGQLMQAQARVVGTIATQPRKVELIRGIQFQANCQLLTGEAEQRAYQAYCRRFPVAKKAAAPLWQLDLQQLKMTDNTQGFGTKLHWSRTDSAL